MFTSKWRCRLVSGKGRREMHHATAAVGIALLLSACTDTPDPVGIRAPSEPLLSQSSLSDVTLVEGAVLLPNGVRLSGSGAGTPGALWNTEKQLVREGFESEFTFRLTPNGRNTVDGFAFVVQGVAGNAIGGGNFGYERLPSSVAVLFDTRSGSKVSVRTEGSLTTALASANVARLNDGQLQAARVIYADGQLRVVLNGDEVLAVSLDLANIAGLMDANGDTWAGFTASSRTRNGQSHDILEWAFRASDSPYPVAVNVADAMSLPGVTAVATNRVTGEFFTAITDADGNALFNLLPGRYLFSAYRFQIADPLDLVVWPNAVQDGSSPGLGAYVPVIWHPIYGSLVKTPANFFSALASPTIVGPGGARGIPLSFNTGATVQCTLLDPDGNQLSPQGDEQVFGVTPIAEDALLPPRFRPSDFSWTEEQLASLPRGIGFATALLAGSRGCELPGAPEGKVVLESRPVTAGGQTFVYRASTVVGPGGLVRTIAGPSPEMVEANWHHDERISDLTDLTGPTDFGGAIVYGWEKGAAASAGNFSPGNAFVVSSQFKGQGTYTVELWKGEPGSGPPDVTISASCSAKKCSLASSSIRVSGVTVGVSGVSVVHNQVEWGTVVWSVNWPSLVIGDVVTFRIIAGTSNNASDTLAPSASYLSAVKRPGRAQSYLLAGMM
jgi:hypothetical protein